MTLKPDDDAPPGGGEGGAGAASVDLLSGAGKPASAPAKGKGKAAAAAPAKAPVERRATPKDTEVAEIVRGHFYEGKWPHVTTKGPGELIELPVGDVRRFQAMGLLKDPNSTLILPTNGPRFFRDDAPGR